MFWLQNLYSKKSRRKSAGYLCTRFDVAQQRPDILTVNQRAFSRDLSGRTENQIARCA